MINCINHIHMYFVEIVSDSIERFMVYNINYFHMDFVCIINTTLVLSAYYDPL